MDHSSTPSLAVETEGLRRAYAAFNRNDISATVEALDPEIEWTEPAEFPAGGTYHGHDGIKAYLSQSRSGWAEGSSEPERFIVAGDKIIVFVHARVRLKGSTEWRETRLADVFTFRNGRVPVDFVHPQDVTQNKLGQYDPVPAVSGDAFERCC